jgi:hypothetical protein
MQFVALAGIPAAPSLRKHPSTAIISPMSEQIPPDPLDPLVVDHHPAHTCNNSAIFLS